MTEAYCWSHDEKNYHGRFDTRELALEAGLETAAEGDDVWTGVVEPYDADIGSIASQLADSAIELMGEAADAAVGFDAADGWPNASEQDTDDLAAKIADAVKRWAEQCLESPRFSTVTGVVRHRREG